MRHTTMLVAILAFVPFAIATAQVPLRPGERVRVTLLPLCPPNTLCVKTPRQSVETFVTWKADSLIMESNGNALALPLDSVTKLEVSRGQKSRAGQGAGIGLLGGGLLGFLISSGSCTEGKGFLDTRKACIQVSTVGGAVVGTFLGLAFGAVIMTDRWEEVPLDRVRVSFGPLRDGRLGLGASVRF